MKKKKSFPKYIIDTILISITLITKAPGEFIQICTKIGVRY